MLEIWVALAVSLAIVLGMTSVSAASQNLFVNGSLEEPDSAGTWPAGWELIQWDGLVAKYEWLRQDSHSGNRSVKMGDWYTGGWGVTLASPVIRVNPTTTYILSFWYKTEGLTGPKQAQVQVRFLRSQGELRMSKGLANATDWTPFSLQLRLPPGTRGLTIRVGLQSKRQGWVYVDDLSLCEATDADFTLGTGVAQMPKLPDPRQVPKETWEASGSYRVQQEDDAWWLVDPQGRPTLSIGTVLNYPWNSNPDLRDWTRVNYPGQSDYLRWAFDLADGWGFNSLAGWSDDANIWALDRYQWDKSLPRMQHYAVANFALLGGAELKATNDRGEAKHGNHAFPDPYNPVWRSLAEQHMTRLAQRYRGHSQFVGYFVDNELDITQLFRYVWGTYSAREFVKFLQVRYGDFARLSDAWQLRERGIPAVDFSDLIELKPEPTSFEDPSLPDYRDFAREMFAEYVRFVVGLVKKADASHLVLGPRQHEGVSTETMEYADLLSAFDIVVLNDYPENTGLLGLGPAQQAYIEKIHRITGRPILIGEFSVPALDSGLYEKEKLDWSWPDAVATQEQRADAYEATFRWLLSQPYVVGVHWFMWHDLDHPDSEQRRANRGLIGRNHEPWQPLVDRMKMLHHLALGQ